jgi:hypothetical protein
MCKFQALVSSPTWRDLFENYINYILELHVESRMQKIRGIEKTKGKRKVPFYWLLVKVNQNNTTIINFSHQPTCDLRFGCVICMVVDYRY